MGSAKALKQQANLSEMAQIGSEERAQLKAAFTPRLTHGGVPSVKKRKTIRPFSPNAPTHLVLHSKRARGTWSLSHRKHHSKISSMVYVYAKRFKVKVYRVSVCGNQIHLLVKAGEKKHLSDFLRVLAGRVAVVVSGARKHVKRIGRFWDYLCWSKLVNWGQEFFQVRQFVANADELVSASVNTSGIRDLISEWESDHISKNID